MQFEWDENKNRINKAKHGVLFELAKKVWDDPHVWTYLDRFEGGEARPRRWRRRRPYDSHRRSYVPQHERTGSHTHHWSPKSYAA